MLDKIFIVAMIVQVYMWVMGVVIFYDVTWGDWCTRKNIIIMMIPLGYFYFVAISIQKLYKHTIKTFKEFDK